MVFAPVTVHAQTDTVEADIETDAVQADAVEVNTAQADMEPLDTARNYLGVALSTVAADEGTPTVAAQFGVDILERLELRGCSSPT